MTLAGLAGPDIAWLAAAALVAGTVRGFSGFGTAMVYLPVAGQVLPPFVAIATLLMMDLLGPLPNLRRGWGEMHRPDLLRLCAGLLALLPVGIWVLSRADPDLFRYAVSLVSLLLLAALLSGLRYRGALVPPLVYATGGVSGFLMGVSGLPGPPVVLFYMASPLPAAAIRATVLVYLFLTDLAMLPMLALFGQLSGGALLAGLALAAPNLLGNVLGARLFRPERERVYRVVAYGVIALSAVAGLPVWD